MSEGLIQQYEAALRSLKGEGYEGKGVIAGVRVKIEGRDEGEEYTLDGVNLEDVKVKIGVTTEDGRRMGVLMPSPRGSWDLTNDLVVLLEYLDLEPEELHRLNGEDYEVPVKFDGGEEDYTVDFDRMRDDILED